MILLACVVGLYLSVGSVLLHPDLSGWVGLPEGTYFSPWPQILGTIGGLLTLAATAIPAPAIRNPNTR